MVMTLEEHLDALDRLVHFNRPGVPNQANVGPAADLDKYLRDNFNEAGREEFKLGRIHGSWKAFFGRFSVTWPAGQETLEIPPPMRGKRVIAFRDETNVSPGPIQEVWDPLGVGSGVYEYDLDTWGLNPTPADQRLYTLLYLREWENLQNNDDIINPSLMAESHQDLVKWSAAILMRATRDETPPAFWVSRRLELRRAWVNELSKGKIGFYPPPKIRHYNPDASEIL